MNAEDKKTVQSFNFDIIESIISNPKLRVSSEDDVVEFINELYLKETKFSSLYCYVYFNNVSSNMMKIFVENISIDDITNDTWKSLSNRLCEEINWKETKNQNNIKSKERYINKENQQPKKKTNTFKTILYEKENSNFTGLINFLKNENNIKDEIDITCSSIGYGDPWSIILYNEEKSHFYTNYDNPSWICIEFKKHKIIPTNYTIKSGDDSDNPKNFVLEGSTDKNEWIEIDRENNCTDLKGSQSIKTFSIQKDRQKSFKYLRLRVEQNWCNNLSRVQIRSLEFYGNLI